MLKLKFKSKDNKKGAALVEYGLLVGLIGTLSMGSVLALGGAVEDMFDQTRIALASSTAAATPPPPTDPCGSIAIGDTCSTDSTTYIGDTSSGRVYMNFSSEGYTAWKGDANATVADLGGDDGYSNSAALLSHGTTNGYTYNHMDTCSLKGSGWYVPTLTELYFIEAYMEANGISSSSYGGAVDVGSSTTGAGGTTYRTYNFFGGTVGSMAVTTGSAILCVRTFKP